MFFYDLVFTNYFEYQKQQILYTLYLFFNDNLIVQLDVDTYMSYKKNNAAALQYAFVKKHKGLANANPL